MAVFQLVQSGWGQPGLKKKKKKKKKLALFMKKIINFQQMDKI